MRRNTAQHGRPVRHGFTLIELLVVISIIAVITALSAAALFRILGATNTSNTKTLITRLNSRLQQQTAYAFDKSRGINGSDTVQPFATNLSGGDSERALVIHQKLRMKQWFPTSFAEALTGGGAKGYPPLNSYVAYLGGYGINATTVGLGLPTVPPPQPYESAACLYMILQRGPETTGDSDLGVTSSTRLLGPSPGIPTLVDAWGQPLMFVRWPTGDLLPGGGGGSGISPVNPSGAQIGGPPFADPLDPKGKLTNQAWLFTGNVPSAQRTTFEALCHPLPNRTTVGTITKGLSINLAPVILSSGSDKQYGVDLGTLNAYNQSQANDNLYNR